MLLGNQTSLRYFSSFHSISSFLRNNKLRIRTRIEREEEKLIVPLSQRSVV